MQRNDDATIQVIAERINSMQNDVSDLRDTMRDSMKEMSAAVTKLVQMEERQIYMNQSYERLANTLDKMQAGTDVLEKRIDNLEKELPLMKQATKWVYAAVWAVVAAAATFVAKTIGIL
jgi:DNA repair ATPase RecN